MHRVIPSATIAPTQGRSQFSRRAERLLLLCYNDPKGISTVLETVAYMQKASCFDVNVCNLFEHRQNMCSLALNAHVSFDDYDAIIIHNTLAYNVENLRNLDAKTTQKLRTYQGAKIILKQDENFRFKEIAYYIGEVGFDAIFTCLPLEAIDKIYPKEMVGEPIIKRMLTGYVTPAMRSFDWRHTDRPIDIGYRGSIQPLSFGRLAYEKRKIGDDVTALLADAGLHLNISSQWEDRLGNEAWLKFLASSKATLGSESGSNLFDLHGDLESLCQRAESILGPFSQDHAYAEAYLDMLSSHEGNIQYGQISPRHFEAAATGTIQLLYPGEYSGIFKAGRHFFPLARDYSNLEEAVALIQDTARRTEMAETAFQEIIMNPEYWIETFVAQVDAVTAEILEKKACKKTPRYTSTSAKNIVLLVGHAPQKDPRLAWISNDAPEGTLVHQIGVLPPQHKNDYMQTSDRGALCMAIPRIKWNRYLAAACYARIRHHADAMAAYNELRILEMLSNTPTFYREHMLGAPVGHARSLYFWRQTRYFLDTAATLLTQVIPMRGVDAVIATDLDTLLPALIMKGLFGVPVFYDAHEYWPQSDPECLENEEHFWEALEARMVGYADGCLTVSPGLAEFMQARYHVPFIAVPNCEPLASYLPKETVAKRANQNECIFLYQGGFAPKRGIDLLIEVWADVDPEAILWLRGPDSEYKEEMKILAQRKGLLGSRIFFPPALKEQELVMGATEAEVGLIPYTPYSVAYSHCCPNKLSQYMAAGLPILANTTSFVSQVIDAAECGVVVPFTKRNALIHAINTLTHDSERRKQYGQNAHHFFRQTYHWEKASAPLYAMLAAKLTNPPGNLLLYAHQDCLEAQRISWLVFELKNKILFIFFACWRCIPLSLRKKLKPLLSRLLRRVYS